jgi:ubiquinone/menaquinone biosynthesis C-methylase UbiE/predicted Fe-Mo cluster-binding NifX family protein
MSNHYPESRLEVRGFIASHYNLLLDLMTLGEYLSLMKRSIELMEIKPRDRIIDLGCGPGRNACLMRSYLSEEGLLVGVDISQEMLRQFRKRCSDLHNVKIINARIEDPLVFKEGFDKVFISFVLHGFPQEARERVLGNIFNLLKITGDLFILDYNEFSYREMPLYLKIPFRLIECPYAFDFITRDWKGILKERGFDDFREYLFLGKYIRLLRAKKLAKVKSLSGSESVRLTIPTDDGINIFEGMLGKTRNFFIYEIKGSGQINFVERRVNPYATTLQPLKTLEVYELIRDTSIILCKRIGRSGIERLKQRGLKIYFGSGNIRTELNRLIEAEGERFKSRV